MKRHLFASLLALSLLACLVLPAAAAVPNLNRLGSIRLTMTGPEGKVSGGSVAAYYVAEVKVENGNQSYVFTQDFNGCQVPLDGSLSAPETAAKIKAYAAEKQVTPIAVQTVDSQGVASFRDLKVGLYLLCQKEAAPGYSEMLPFLIGVPQQTGASYEYHVDASPKMGPVQTLPTTEPTQPTQPPVTPPGDRLMQTGQLNWPVPVLAVGGAVLFLTGLGLNLSARRKRDEG